MNLVETGSLGAITPYPDVLLQSLFVHAPNGRYYEAHEIGNSLLLTPAAVGGLVSSAWIGRALGPMSLSGGPKLQMLVAKTLASLLETAASAIGCYYLFLLFGLFYEARFALVLTGLFVFATFYAAYFRAGWDVLPACNAVMILLYCSARLVLAPAVRVREAVPVGLWFGIACMFRFSLAPFLGLGLLILLWDVRKKVSGNAVLAAIGIAVVLFVPNLVFNAIRTGSPFRPANTLPQYLYQTALTGSLMKGMFGLLLSPNHGLFVYSPILLLLALLPWHWRSLPAVIKSLLRAYLPAVLLYYLMISKLLNWGAAGWGPRYLLPLLPVLFLGAAAVAHQLWLQRGARSRLLVSLCLVALLLSVPTLLVDYSNILKQDPDSYRAASLYPTPHIAVWKNLFSGLRGQRGQSRAEVGTAQEADLMTAFPDLLVTRVYQVAAGRSRVAAGVLLLVYLAALGCTFYLLWCSVQRRESAHSGGGFHR